MKFMNILVMLSLLSMAACSSNKTEDNTTAETTSLDEKLLEEDADFIVDSDDSALMEETNKAEAGAMASAEAIMDDQPMMEETMPSTSPAITEMAEYTVQAGDTLMLVAFKVWGDYERWKELSQLNGGIEMGNLPVGKTLKYVPNGFTWNPQGLPHLIKRGDTLGTISTEKYGTDQKWKDIWDNNRPMIKDPNLIFAGFTLYYIPVEERDLASEPQEL